MLNFLHQFIPTIIILGFLIFVHELGHFLMCLWSRVRVLKFSIGFGPEIIRWKRRDTEYAISLIPLGGFVKPAGESYGELEGRAPEPGDFLAASKLQRFGILLAGVVMNYLFAVLLFVIVFWTGYPVLKSKIGGFVTGYPAEASGLKVGDDVRRLNGKAVDNWEELTASIFDNQLSELVLDVNRGGQTVIVRIAPKVDEGRDIFGDKRRISRIGIRPSNEFLMERFGLLESIHRAFVSTANITTMTYKALWRLLTGRMSVKTLSGPIGIMVMAGSAAQAGLAALLQLTALISVSLAVINLLPIPALDGGHIFFLLIGFLRGKEVSMKTQERVTQVGFTLLMILMVFVIYNDLANIGVVEKVKTLFGNFRVN